MRSKASTITGATLLILLGIAAGAADEKAALARAMWSAFQCSTFAEMSKNEKEQMRLFSVGLKAGREFIEAAKKNQISEDAFRSQVPIGVSMLLGGPSTDFMIGRIFANATQRCINSVVKKDRNGFLLPINSWVNDDELKRTIASTKYLTGNCTLIR